MRFIELEMTDRMLDVSADPDRGGKYYAWINPTLVTAVCWCADGNCKIHLSGDDYSHDVRGSACDIVRMVEDGINAHGRWVILEGGDA